MKKHGSLRVQRLKLKLFDYVILGLVIFSMFFLVLVFGRYVKEARTEQKELIYSTMENMAENQRTQFENFLEDKINMLQAIAQYSQIYKMDEIEQIRFIKNRSKDFGFEYIFIVNKDGMGFYIDENVYRDQKEELFFKEIMENDVVVTDPFYKEDGTVIMTACVSIRNASGKKVGALCGAMNVTRLQKLIQDNKMILNGKCFIIDNNGIYITADNPARVTRKMSVFETKNSELELIVSALTEKVDKRGHLRLEGVEYEAILTYLEDYSWTIVQLIPEQEVNALYDFAQDFQNAFGLQVVILAMCIIRLIYCWNKSNDKIYTDALTKGNSRAACYDLLDSLEKKRKHAVTIIFMDLNRFKYVNDTYGHDKGDELLCIFSNALEKTFGRVGFVGRMGGDEFIAVLLDATENQIEELWKQLTEILKDKSAELNIPYEIESSYGYATRAVQGTESLELIIQYADEKMYEYKMKTKMANK